MEKLTFIFNVCIALGLVLPLLDLALGFLGSLLDFDFDIGGHHVGDVFSGGDAGGGGNVLPFNIMCLCFSLVVFGALGRLCEGLMANAWAAAGIIAGLLGLAILAYWLIFKFIVKPLKKSSPTAISHWDLLSERGRLTLRITKDSPGMVSLRDSTGAMISYRARAKEEVLDIWEGEIPQGAEVIVTDVDDKQKLVYVRPASTMENMNLKHNNIPRNKQNP
jgi:membrane protein implicated in regulation of membrane protease activity